MFGKVWSELKNLISLFNNKEISLFRKFIMFIVLLSAFSGLTCLIIAIATKSSIAVIIAMAALGIEFLFVSFIDKETRSILLKIIGIPLGLLLAYFIITPLSVYMAIQAEKLHQFRDYNWLLFFGTIIGSAITVFGAYTVMHVQLKSGDKLKAKTDKLILLNDLKYISVKVNEYLNLKDKYTDSDDFHKSRYLNFCDNWRELTSSLHKHKVFDEKDVEVLYSYFTGTYYLADKYNELHEAGISEIDSDTQAQEKYKKRKRNIRKSINDKYTEMSKIDINKLIKKLKYF